MNRLFGRGKPKEPGPSITDVIGTVSTASRKTKFEKDTKSKISFPKTLIQGGFKGRRHWKEDYGIGQRASQVQRPNGKDAWRAEQERRETKGFASSQAEETVSHPSSVFNVIDLNRIALFVDMRPRSRTCAISRSTWNRQTMQTRCLKTLRRRWLQWRTEWRRWRRISRKSTSKR